jgi:hypothetical protein
MRVNKFERRCRVSFGEFVGAEEHTLSPSVLWRMSQALCSAIREVCEMAVEKMNGRAKLIKKERIVGGQSKTAILSAPARLQTKGDIPPEQPTALPKVISLTPTLPCSPRA